MIDLEELAELDRLEARRQLRQLYLERVQGRQLGIGALFLVAGAGLSLHSPIIPNAIGGVLLLTLFGGIAVIHQSHRDRCPRCEAEVDVFNQLHCGRCGEGLEELPHLPETFGEALEELEADLQQQERAPVEVADGVEVVA